MPIDRYGAMSVNQEGTKPTYSAAISGLVMANAATDVFTIFNPAGSTKVVKILRMNFSATATSAAAADVMVAKRSTLNTGGTATNPAAVPHDSSDIAATATISAYTANPTTGTLVGYVHADKVGIATATAANIQEQFYDYANRPEKALTLRAGECASFYMNGGTYAGNLTDIDITWTEENANA